MTFTRERLAERGFLAIAAIAGSLLFHSIALATAEPPGCANQTCCNALLQAEGA